VKGETQKKHRIVENEEKKEKKNRALEIPGSEKLSLKNEPLRGG